MQETQTIQDKEQNPFVKGLFSIFFSIFVIFITANRIIFLEQKFSQDVETE